jgi:signal transduction histidine kinase
MVSFMATSGIVLLLAGGAFITYQVISFRDLTVRSLRTRAEFLAANLTAALAFENQDDAMELLSAFRDDPHMVAACVYDRTGGLFASYPDGAPAEPCPATWHGSGARFEGQHVVFLQPVMEGDRQLGTVSLRSDLGESMAQLRMFGLVAAVVIAISLGIAFALAFLLQKRIAQPILSLAETAKRVTERRDYALRAPAHHEGELGLLTTSFNGMLGEIQQRDREIRQLNEELEQRVLERTSQLEAANRELEGFSYSVSHDLRAPLRAIDGFSQILLDEQMDALDAEGRRLLSIIRENTVRMGQLIDDLLTFSRMGRTALERAPLDMTHLARSVAEELIVAAGRDDLDVTVGKLPAADGDLPTLRQVWTNLISNAIKYSGKREHAAIAISGRTEGPEHVFTIEDNGVGFDMQYSDKLFGVFQRLHSPSEFEGTGVGLALVQRIVHRHGGRVWAEGRPGEGATFHFALPSSTKPSPVAAPPASIEEELIHA